MSAEVCPGPHDGQGCEGAPDGPCGRPANFTLVLVGGPFDAPPTRVPFCYRCTKHWRKYHPERIQL